jgi:rhamnose transport system ATP-binding protein
VPDERGKQGVVVDLPIFQNVALPSLKKTGRNGFLKLADEFALTRQYTGRLDLRAASLSQNAGTLSGGNQQKVVIAKWLATKPRVIILDEPTKGIDIGSKAAVHAFMAELVAEGLAVIMVSSELPEIMGMSDRIVVMRSGRMVEVLDNKDLTADRVVRLAIGAEEAAA